jgi:YD repeat-containing protein
MRAKAAIKYVLLLALFCAHALAQSSSNLKSDKLIGNVKTVRTEQTWTENNVESRRVLMTVETYDRSGNKTEWDAYKGSEKPLRALFTYDEKGRVLNDEWYNSADELAGKTNYTYDGKGRLVEETTSNGLKTLYSYNSRNNQVLRRTYDLATSEGGRKFGDANVTVRSSYDKHNNLIRVASFKRSGVRVWNPELQAHRIVYSYDPNKRIKSQTVFNANNSVRTLTQFEYDSKDRTVTESVFAGKSGVTTVYRYSYEFDPTGNWITQVKTKDVPSKGKTGRVVVDTTYRTIDYWN